MLGLLFSSFIFGSLLFAAEGHDFHVVPLTPEAPVSVFTEDQKAGFRIHDLRGPSQIRYGMPTVELREQAITDSGLEIQVANFDELDRDVLWMRAQEYEFERFAGYYGKFPHASLKRFYAIVRQPVKK